MVKKTIFFIFLFFFLVLFQTSFLPHFITTPLFRGWFLNLVLISVIVINFLEKSKAFSGFLSAFFAGFFIDIFSETFIGFHIFIFILISIFVKYFFKRYVQLFWKREKLL